jgi:RimJ/RimL family protein N-acetyltransferase
MGGSTNSPRRLRFDGVLDAGQVERARKTGHALAYCPLQLGWVPLDSADDEDALAPLSWQVGTIALHKKVYGTGVYPMKATLSLRVWVADDLPVYMALLSDPTLWRFMPEEAPQVIDAALSEALIAVSSEATHHLVRAVAEGGQPIGQVRLEYLPDRRSGEVSYWLGAKWRGRGLGRLAVEKFVGQCFGREPGLQRIFARVHPENTASHRLLLGAGFTSSDRAALGVGPRGRDRGDWGVFVLDRQ